jgi:hypothetical protein
MRQTHLVDIAEMSSGRSLRRAFFILCSLRLFNCIISCLPARKGNAMAKEELIEMMGSVGEILPDRALCLITATKSLPVVQNAQAQYPYSGG